MQQLLIALALFVSTALAAQQGESNEYKAIEVSVTNVTSEKGKVEFALYTENGFLQKPFATKSANIEGKISRVVFENIPAGEYAVICFHDANENNLMDFEMNGMPIENFGASNNVYEMGPPVFDNSKFVHGNTDIKLEIKF